MIQSLVPSCSTVNKFAQKSSSPHEKISPSHNLGGILCKELNPSTIQGYEDTNYLHLAKNTDLLPNIKNSDYL